MPDRCGCGLFTHGAGRRPRFGPQARESAGGDHRSMVSLGDPGRLPPERGPQRQGRVETGRRMSFRHTSSDEHLSRARALVAGAGRIVVLTGAGISTDSGIPDFRGPQGVWTKDPAAQRNSHITEYIADAEIRRRVWQTRLTSPAWTAEPNPGHLAIVDLERQERLHAGGHPEHRRPAPAGRQRPGDGGRAPRHHAGGDVPGLRRSGPDGAGARPAPSRGGRPGLPALRRTAEVGHHLLRPVPGVADLARAHRAATECDLLLAVGSSLTVSPACDLVPLAAAAGAQVVIVNAQPTPYDGIAGAVVRGPDQRGASRAGAAVTGMSTFAVGFLTSEPASMRIDNHAHLP